MSCKNKDVFDFCFYRYSWPGSWYLRRAPQRTPVVPTRTVVTFAELIALAMECGMVITTDTTPFALVRRRGNSGKTKTPQGQLDKILNRANYHQVPAVGQIRLNDQLTQTRMRLPKMRPIWSRHSTRSRCEVPLINLATEL